MAEALHLRARLGDSGSGRYRLVENSLLTKHVVAAGYSAKDAGSTPAASTMFSRVRVNRGVSHPWHEMWSLTDYWGVGEPSPNHGAIPTCYPAGCPVLGQFGFSWLPAGRKYSFPWPYPTTIPPFFWTGVTLVSPR